MDVGHFNFDSDAESINFVSYLEDSVGNFSNL